MKRQGEKRVRQLNIENRVSLFEKWVGQLLRLLESQYMNDPDILDDIRKIKRLRELVKKH